VSSVNKAILIGNLGRDPELTYTPAGKAICKFSIATSETWKDASGVKQSKTTWHNIVLWERLAEIARDYLKKGMAVYIEGRIENRSYEDKESIKRNISEVVGTSLQLLNNRSKDEAPVNAGPAPATTPTDDDDDLPF
jgi:single-strand DNA-binding protein